MAGLGGVLDQGVIDMARRTLQPAYDDTALASDLAQGEGEAGQRGPVCILSAQHQFPFLVKAVLVAKQAVKAAVVTAVYGSQP